MYGAYDTTIHFADFWEYVFSLRGFAYFTIGIAIRMGVFDSFGRCLWRYAGHVSLLMGLSLLMINVWSRLNDIVWLQNFSDFAMVVPLMYGIWHLTMYIQLPDHLVSSSFAVYVLHEYFLKMSIIFIALLKLRGEMNSSLLIATFRWLGAVLLSIAFAIGLKRLSRRSANLLFGGR